MEDLDERQRRGETRSWYRVPSKGVTAGSKRIAQAVDNEKWQKVRHSMKGISTSDKINTLEEYWEANGLTQMVLGNVEIDSDDDVCIRIDNYIKALCRGGQLEAGCSIVQLIDGTLRDNIRK